MGDFKRLTITDLDESDRPREKLRDHGSQCLSDAELLAILIGSGSRNETAVDLCRRILLSVNNDLNQLGRLQINKLVTDFHGIGEAKAISILAALELGRRRKFNIEPPKDKISSSWHAFDKMHAYMTDLAHEEFWILLLNQANVIIDKQLISRGGLTETSVDIRLIFNAAILNKASGIILCHNHPSGNNKASDADIKLTERIVSAGKILNIIILDHIIIAGQAYYSFADEGIL